MAAIEGIERIRFTTSHPMEFSDSLIEVYGRVPELVSFLHLPVQSGSDRMLAMMKRGHMAIEYKAKIRRLREIRPDITISSDFIVGFPGETEQDFQDTLKLIEEIGFDHSYSFIYSRRPGTPAAELPDDVPLAVKQARLERLQQLINTPGPAHQPPDGGHDPAGAGGSPSRKDPQPAGGPHREQPGGELQLPRRS